MGMIRNENFYTVFGWMLNKLHLSGNKLTIFAVIYSFSQDGKSEFKGSLSYLMDFVGASRATVIRCLTQLEADGLICKEKKNSILGSSDFYRVTNETLERVSQNDTPPPGGSQNDTPPPGGSQNDTPPPGGSQNDTPPPGGSQNDTPPPGGSQNDTPPPGGVSKRDGGCFKMRPRGSQNDTPLPYYIIHTISTVDNKERKKENRKRNRDIEKEKLSKEKERAQQKFSSMPDEELLAWGEQSIDLTNPQQEMEFYEWCRECRKRKETATRWRGRVIKNDHVFAILKSHDEIMTEMGVSDALRDSLKQFLRNCYLNKHLISNDKLTDIICRLNDFYGRDDAGKIKSVNTAISGGWYDIRELR